MGRKKIIPIRELVCGFCNNYHEFEQVRESEKLNPKYATFSNKLYIWSGECSQQGCRVRLESFDPVETLERKDRKVTKNAYRPFANND